MPTIIGLGRRKGAGKDTVASMIADILPPGVVSIEHFATPLREAAEIMFGLTKEDMLAPERKEVPQERLYGFSPRQLLQKLGTDFGRDMVSNRLWIDNLAWRIQKKGTSADSVFVVPDVRFANEAQAIRDMGGFVIEIQRDGLGVDGHASENDDIKPDLVIENNGTLEDLYARVFEMVADRVKRKYNFPIYLPLGAIVRDALGRTWAVIQDDAEGYHVASGSGGRTAASDRRTFCVLSDGYELVSLPSQTAAEAFKKTRL